MDIRYMLVIGMLPVFAVSPGTFAETAKADPPPNSYIAVWTPGAPGIAYGFAAGLTRSGGSSDALRDFTVAAQLVAKNGPGVNQWAFGVAAEAWAQPGSRSILVGIEAAIINEEPANLYPKVANNAVMKNRDDTGVDPGAPLNANSIAYWITAQSGTGTLAGRISSGGAPLASAILSGAGRATQSRPDGNYRLVLPVGRTS